MSDNNSNAVSQLPLEFRLYKNGKHVGFMKFDKLQQSLWSTDGEIWHYWSKFKIHHNEKRQYTGFKDKNGDKIYFGDKLRIPEDYLIFTVVLEGGRIFAVHSDMSPGFGASSFKNMERK